MPKVVTSPVKRWQGTVTLSDPLTLPQAEAVDEAMTTLPPSKDGQVTLTAIDKLHLPAIFACVEQWNLEGLPDPLTMDNLPMSPLRARHSLIDRLWQEITGIYLEDSEVPNE